MSDLTPEELEKLEADLLPNREALSVIGPLPPAPGIDAASDIAEIADLDESA